MASNPDLPRTGPQDADVAEYHALSAMAVAGVVAGLLSPFWIIGPLLWLLPVPLLGILFSTLALWRISRDWPDLAGRKAALIGLFLSVFSCIAAPVNWITYRQMIRHEARQFARLWFEHLARGEPHKAHQLTLEPDRRRPFDDDLLAWYRDVPRMRDDLEHFANQRLQRTLLALGRAAHVRYYQTVGQRHRATADDLALFYAVTFTQDGKRQSFFVLLEVKRVKTSTGRANWYVRAHQGDVLPDALASS